MTFSASQVLSAIRDHFQGILRYSEYDLLGAILTKMQEPLTDANNHLLKRRLTNLAKDDKLAIEQGDDGKYLLIATPEALAAESADEVRKTMPDELFEKLLARTVAVLTATGNSTAKKDEVIAAIGEAFANLGFTPEQLSDLPEKMLLKLLKEPAVLKAVPSGDGEQHYQLLTKPKPSRADVVAKLFQVVKDLQQHNAQLQQQLATRPDQTGSPLSPEKIKAVVDTAVRLNRQNVELRKQIETHTTTDAEQRAQLSTLQRSLADAQTENSELTEALDNARGTIRRLNGDLSAANKKAEDLQAKSGTIDDDTRAGLKELGLDT